MCSFEGNVYLANLQAREAKCICPSFPGLPEILAFFNQLELLQAKFLWKISAQVRLDVYVY